MAITYDTLGSTVTVLSRGTVAPGNLNTEVAIVGGYDSANSGSSTSANSVTIVNTGSEADSAFGENSELAYQSRLAFANGATAVHGVPLSETSTTESFSSTSSGSLSSGNMPAMDPNLHPDEDITAQDTTAGASVTVNIVYDSTVSAPSDSNTMNLNPVTGDWAADESASYDISYAYGDFTTAIETAAGQTVRAVGVCSEDTSPKTTLESELSSKASDFRFMRGITGSEVEIAAGSTGNYTPDTDSWRMVEVAPALGTSPQGKVRLVGGILGMVASQPINVEGSITFDRIDGLDSLHTEYSPTQAENFDRVTAVTDEFEVAEGLTTSTEAAFTDIYKVEIIDFIVEQLYNRVKNYAGGSNAQPAQRRFKSRLKRTLASYSVPQASPPLLASGDGSQPYTVSVKTGSTDTEADVDVGIDVAPIAKEVKLDISVGPIQFNGANV